MVAAEMHLLNLTELNIAQPKRWRHGLALLLAGSVVAGSTCGCVHREFNTGREVELTLPKLTAWVTGPVAICLTNQSGFEAECLLTLAGAANAPRKLPGRIFAQGDKLRFDTVADHARSGGAGEFSVIWDGDANRGYVLSEGLQGYAVLVRSIQLSNVLTRTIAGPPDRLEGHPVDHAVVTGLGGDGQSFSLQLTRAEDLGHLPVELRSDGEPGAFDLALTNVRLIQPAAAVFLPPDDFTKYASETALLEELVAREHDVFGGGHERDRLPGEPEPPDLHHRTDSNGP
jgi:hypothetical protein